MAYTRRSDLAVELHELWKKNAANGTQNIPQTSYTREGYTITKVVIETAEAAEAIGKPIGSYRSMDISRYWKREKSAYHRAVYAIAGELTVLLKDLPDKCSALVVGLGNAHMTPDAIGPLVAKQLLATRHMVRDPSCAMLCPVSVLSPGVLAQTGMETGEIIQGIVKQTKPDFVIAVDALAAARLERICTTIQFSDSGIVPGSGVGNHRFPLNADTLGVPVYSIGVPTVMDSATLALDILEEHCIKCDNSVTLGEHAAQVMVTPRDIDAQVRELSKLIAFGINLALQPQLSLQDLDALVS